MRLTESEQAAIVSVVRRHLGQMLQAVYLHGSRVNDAARGGDIDLILVVDVAGERSAETRLHYLTADLKGALGDQRIDITVATTPKLREEPFLRAAMRHAVRLDA